MDFDVKDNLAAVDRSVSAGLRDKRRAHTLMLARNYATAVENLWSGITSSEHIPRWFLPISGELKLDGHYQLEGNANGVITACQPPSHLALTWEFCGDISWVDVQCVAAESGWTRLILKHTAHSSERWDKYGAGAAGVGWELILLGLALYIMQPHAPKPDEAAFAASANGKALIVGSSRGWEQAAIAAGADPITASAAAQCTTAFYLGEPH